MHPNHSWHRGKLVSQSDETIKLVLLRHGQSEWNRLNLFTGWTDVDLSDQGREEAKAAGIVMKEAGFDFDIC
ncbi:MAG: histidine phosphatase family protein, partial [Candidatus Methanomethylophilaceae archaeon]|nr:histidine phosphatase family protein [Candidatus Methanomethylophilaceae archaeon]